MNTTPMSRPQWPAWIVFCCLAILAALVLGVGVGSHLVLRHLVQTAPVWIGVILGFRRSRSAGWATLPLFLFWLLLMSLIWLYLLGISKLLSGHFTGLEIAMTIVVGLASVAGLGVFSRSTSSISWIARAGLFIGLLAIQVACFMASFSPSIAHR